MRKPCGVPLTQNRYREPDLDGPLCEWVRKPGHTKCEWHWLAKQPIGTQVEAARRRREASPVERPRMRVPEDEWPDGQRWCSGCQGYVPLFYATGSRCRAHASEAAHASHVRRTYEITPEEYEALLRWQGGRCYICGQLPRSKRLAIDHNHRTDEVRGLLCANDEWGCNVLLRRLLNDVEVARRALAYVELSPLARMRRGDPAPAAKWAREGVTASLRAMGAPRAGWDPFGDRGAPAAP